MISRAKYDKYINGIRSLVEIYEQKHLNNLVFQYKTADSKNINYSFKEMNIAHLLGVNTKVLEPIVEDKKSSYGLLKYLIKHSNFVWQNLNRNNKLLEDTLFSSYIDNKLEAFTTNINFKPNDVEVCLELDKEKTYISKFANESIQLDYIILRKKENNYSLLGLKKDVSGYLQPITSMLIKPEELGQYAKFFYKQNTTFFTYGDIYDSNKKEVIVKIWPDLNQKKEILQKLLAFKKKYQTSVCVEQAYNYSLEESQNDKNKIKEIISLLTKQIKEGHPIEEINANNFAKEEIEELVETINDTLYKGFRKNSKPYTELKKELLEEKKQRIRVEKKNLKISEKLKIKKEEVLTLTKQLKANSNEEE